MANQYEDDVFDAFYAPIQPKSDSKKKLLRTLLGKLYRTQFDDFARSTVHDPDTRQRFVAQAKRLGDGYMDSANTGTTPSEKLAWAITYFPMLRRRIGGKPTVVSSCLLCNQPPGPRKRAGRSS